MEEYKKIINDNKIFFDKLDFICNQSGESIEGNCFTEHLNIHNKIPELINKQVNHFNLGKNASNIMEIGFNAGHSCLIYLLSNPNSNITIFDICEHKYTIPCFEYLNSVFPNRLQLYEGDSTISVREYFNNNNNVKFDLIHIDGGHEGDIPEIDFYNSLKLASNIIIWDDTQDYRLNQMFNDFIKKRLIEELLNVLPTTIYEHRICKII